MAIAWAYVTTVFPTDTMLTAVGSTLGAIYVAWAEARADASTMGASADQVHALLAAHYAAAAAQGAVGASGTLASVSAGPFSQAYAQPIAIPGGADLQGTAYGRQAWGLMRMRAQAASPFLVA